MAQRGYVFFVTYPRSGHHFLAQSLDALCGLASDYCETYNCLDCYRRPVDCPGKTASQKNRPPQDPVRFLERQLCKSGRRIIKHHDLYRELTWQEDNRYVIQYRHPLESIASWFDFELNVGAVKTDSKKTFVSFLDKKLAQWRFFTEKWIIGIGQSKPNAMLLQYRHLTESPAACRSELLRTLAFLDIPMTCPSAFKEVSEAVAPVRNLQCYRYYDTDLFRRKEDEVEDLMRRVALPRLFDT